MRTMRIVALISFIIALLVGWTDILDKTTIKPIATKEKVGVAFPVHSGAVTQEALLTHRELNGLCYDGSRAYASIYCTPTVRF